MNSIKKNLYFYLLTFFLWGVACTYVYINVPRIKISFFVITAMLLIGMSLLVTKTEQDWPIMIVLLTVLGLSYFIICPFEMVPDEPNHFKRAFEISSGDLFSKSLSDGSGCDKILYFTLKND